MNLRETNPWGVNLNLAGPSIMLSGSVDYFISPTLNVEAGAGLIGYFVGTKFYPNGNRTVNYTPYFGATFTRLASLWDEEMFSGIYLPLGVQHWGSKKFTYAFEVAYFTVNSSSKDNDSLFGSVRLGWRLN